MTVFAYHVSAECLHVFPAVATALDYVTRAQNVTDWLFFDAQGRALKFDQTQEVPAFLRPWASCASCSLEQILFQVRLVKGTKHLDSVEAIRAYLRFAT